jgi:hypothetical protein
MAFYLTAAQETFTNKNVDEAVRTNCHPRIQASVNCDVVIPTDTDVKVTRVELKGWRTQ